MTDADVAAELESRIAEASPGVLDKGAVEAAIAKLFAEWATLDLREDDLRFHIIRRWRPDLLEASL